MPLCCGQKVASWQQPRFGWQRQACSQPLTAAGQLQPHGKETAAGQRQQAAPEPLIADTGRGSSPLPQNSAACRRSGVGCRERRCRAMWRQRAVRAGEDAALPARDSAALPRKKGNMPWKACRPSYLQVRLSRVLALIHSQHHCSRRGGGSALSWWQGSGRQGACMSACRAAQRVASDAWAWLWDMRPQVRAQP